MVLFQSPNVFPGFLDAEDTARAFTPEGWLATGDLGLCPCCKVGRLQVIAVLQGQARLPLPTCVVAQLCRGAAMSRGHVHGFASQHKTGWGWCCTLCWSDPARGRTTRLHSDLIQAFVSARSNACRLELSQPRS